MKHTLSKKNAEKLDSILKDLSSNWSEYENLEKGPLFIKKPQKNKK